VTLSLAGLVYAISIPFSARQYHRLQARQGAAPAPVPPDGGDTPAQNDE
jgi:hypothetical protein